NADPTDRAASAGPQTGPPLCALAGAEGSESGQPLSQLLEVFHGGAEILLRQGGLSTPRETAGHAAQGTAGPGASGLRWESPETGRLRRPPRQSRLADPAQT